MQELPSACLSSRILLILQAASSADATAAPESADTQDERERGKVQGNPAILLRRDHSLRRFVTRPTSLRVDIDQHLPRLFRGQLLILAGESKAGAESLKAFLAAHADHALASEAHMALASLLARSDQTAAKQRLAAIHADQLSNRGKQRLDMLKLQLLSEDNRNGLEGKELPAIPANKVLNAAADWSFAGQKGKVVVVDFWATWCPPCREIIPGLVELQENHGKDGLQVVGVTRFYGSGMDFTADSKLPHDGKRVGGRKLMS